MKKILSLVLAIMMVLSMATVAFAAPEDVTDKNQKKAVDALISLGIVKGYDDGSYKPEQVVTRAEMAKLLVEALGQGGLVVGSESSFKDANGKWYDGYVALAAGLELVNGYPDGTFKGDNPVTYQEAVVMIIRALGYTNQTVNGGVDAYNATKYKTLAQSLGLLKNVTFLAGGANRGDIAIMVYNSLRVQTVATNDKGVAEPIQIDKRLEQVRGTGTGPSNPIIYKEVPVYQVLLGRNKSVSRTTVSIVPDSIDSTSKNYLGDVIDLEPYMYQTLTVYQNNATGYVLFIDGFNSYTVKGNVSAIRYTDIRWANDLSTRKVVFVTKEDGSVVKLPFPVDEHNNPIVIPVYYNGGEARKFSLADFQFYDEDADENQIAGYLNGAEVTFIVDAYDTIIKAVVRQADDNIQALRPYKTGSTTLGRINLPKNALGKVDLSKVKVTGEVTAIEDIVAKDIVTAYYAADISSNPAKVELVVCRDIVEGKVTGTANNASYYVVINGEVYYTYTSKATVGSIGKFFLNADGDIVEFEGKSMSNANYAFISGLSGAKTVNSNGTDIVIKDAYITLLDKEGKKATFNFASNAQYILTLNDGTKYTETVNGKAVSSINVFADNIQTLNTRFGNAYRVDGQYIVTGYELNADNKITAIALKQLTSFDITSTSKVFAAADNVVVFNSYNETVNTVTYHISKLAKVADLGEDEVACYAALNDNGEFELIIAAGNQLVDTSSYAVITGNNAAINNNNQIVRQVTTYVKGEKVEYLTSPSVEIGSGLGRMLFKLTLSNGVQVSNITTTSAIDATATVGNVGTSGLREVSINNYRLAKGATIYVYTQSTATGAYGFTRVGDDNDLDLTNASFDFYNLDGKEGYEVVIISVRR